MEERKDFKKVVNFDKGLEEIHVLDYVFNDGNLSGAVGSVFKPVSKSYYNEVMDEYLNNPQAVSKYWNEKTDESLTSKQSSDIAKSKKQIMVNCGGLDDSHMELWDELRESLGLGELPTHGRADGMGFGFHRVCVIANV